MRFSLFFFAAEDTRAESSYRLLIEAAKVADRHGFEAVWTPERHFQRFGGPYPNPAITSAALATVTERIRLRAGSVVLPLHDPIRLAENFAVIDNLSGGRVDIACVTGSHPDDYALRPEAYADREALLAAGIETIERLWSGQRLHLVNGLGDPVAVELHPKPVQRRLTVWRVCNHAASCAWAGRNGSPLLTSMLYDSRDGVRAKLAAYRAGLTEAGHPPERGRVALMVHAFLGPDAEALAWPAYRRYLEVNLEWQRSLAAANRRQMPAVSGDDLEFMCRSAFDRLLETHGLIGSVERCLAQVERFREMGVDELACLIDFGIDTDAVLASLPQLVELARRTR